MKFDCGPSPQAEFKMAKEGKHPLQQWHKFFTILPRRVDENDCRMLETIERRAVVDTIYTAEGLNYGHRLLHIRNWEYRAIKK